MRDKNGRGKGEEEGVKVRGRARVLRRGVRKTQRAGAAGETAAIRFTMRVFWDGKLVFGLVADGWLVKCARL